MEEDFTTRQENAKDIAIEAIRQLRVHLDGCANLLENISLGDDMIALNYLQGCYNSLIFCKAHLGSVLGGLGKPTPYQLDGNRHSVADIEERADAAGIFLVPGWENLNDVEKIDAMRQELQRTLEIRFWKIYTDYDSLAGNTFSGRVLRRWWDAEKHLVEARYNLGFVLGELRKSYTIN